ncbi:MAG: heme biosynthesis HemY N-terminal domain-containing protein [Gammaproteobacteria bacterium]
MSFLFLFQMLLFICLSALLGVAIYTDPGYLLLSYQDWIIELPLWLGLIFILVGFFSCLFTYQFIKKILQSPQALNFWWQNYQIKKQGLYFHKAWVDLIGQNPIQAKKHFLSSLSSQDPALGYIGAAQAAHQNKEFAERDLYLEKARGFLNYKTYIIDYLKAEWLLQEGLAENSLAIINSLNQKTQDLPLFLKLKLRAYHQTQQSGHLISSINKIKKYKLEIPENLILLEQEAWQNELEQCSEFKQLSKTWGKAGDSIQNIPLITEKYLLKILQFGESDLFLKLIFKSLKNQNYPNTLMQLLLKNIYLNPEKILKFAQNLLTSDPHQPYAILLAAKSSAQLKLWGQARSFYEKYLRVHQDPNIQLELDKLYKHWE